LPRREPTVDLREIATMRFEMLDALGLGDLGALSARVGNLTDRDVDELAYGALDLAKASVDRLLEESSSATPPVVLWADGDSVPEVVGRTLLWADRYLVPDSLADALMGPTLRPTDLERGLIRLLEIRPLIELGVVVPVLSDLAIVLSAEAAHEATNSDLGQPELVNWVDQQLLVEGPTQREVLIIGARDDVALGGDHLELFSHIDPAGLDEENHITRGRLLGPYRPDFDYAPWISQTRRKVIAQLVRDANQAVAVAQTFGGHAVTRAPFRARLLHRKSVPLDAASALVWADVPWLPTTPANRLAEIAAQDAAVEALRAHSRRAFDRAGRGELATVAVDLAGELEEAAHELEDDIRTNRSWGLIRPAPLLTASVVLGATTGPVGAGAALLGAVGGVVPTIGQARRFRRHPAYALVMAKRGHEGS
jgi:hypothetical protein